MDSPIKTTADFAAALKQDPGAVAVGGSGVGTVDHLTLALVAKTQGISADKLNFISFSGGEIVPALVGGKIKAAAFRACRSSIRSAPGRSHSPDRRHLGSSPPQGRRPDPEGGGLDVTVSNWRGVVGAPGMSDAARKAWIEKFDALAASKSWANALEKRGRRECLSRRRQVRLVHRRGEQELGNAAEEAGIVK